MSTVVPVAIPRWQWRVFAPDLSWLTRRLAATHTGPMTWSEEVHFVCAHSSHHAWVQHDMLELRWRKQTDADGFELWDTILKASAPFTRDDVKRLYAAWGLSMPEVDDAPVGLDRLAAVPAVQRVSVTRGAQALRVHGVSCTLESVAAADRPSLQSFAIEHEDPSVIRHVLRDIGLDTRSNTNFLQGLKTALGMGPNETGR